MIMIIMNEPLEITISGVELLRDDLPLDYSENG
jgi:hypothetical protein